MASLISLGGAQVSLMILLLKYVYFGILREETYLALILWQVALLLRTAGVPL